MTIAIAISVPDGIALAADTQTTWNQTITKAKQKNLVIGRRSRVGCSLFENNNRDPVFAGPIKTL